MTNGLISTTDLLLGVHGGVQGGIHYVKVSMADNQVDSFHP